LCCFFAGSPRLFLLHLHPLSHCALNQLRNNEQIGVLLREKSRQTGKYVAYYLKGQIF